MNSRELAAQVGFTEVFDALRSEFRQRARGMMMDSALPTDISNVSKVVIHGLDYRLLCGDQLQWGIQCRMATAGASEIELRGGVIIQAEGRKLLSSYVLWDMERNQFSVPGTYILDRNGVPVRGTGLRCDHRLQPVVATGVYSKK